MSTGGRLLMPPAFSPSLPITSPRAGTTESTRTIATVTAPRFIRDANSYETPDASRCSLHSPIGTNAPSTHSLARYPPQ